MWDVEQYRRIIQKIAKHGNLNGKCVKNKGDIYVQLSRRLYVSVDTVKSWARKNSNGPSDEAVVKQLEAIFNTCLTKNNVEEIKEEDNMKTYSDFVKSNIKEAYKLVMDFIKSDEIENEESYCEMRSNLEKNDFVDDVKYVSEEAYNFFKKSQIFGGELIICKIGSAGQNYVMPYLNRPVSLGLNQIMVRIKENILMPYLYQYLHTEYGEFLISGCINGAVTKTITKTELKKTPVMLPPMELQKEFVDFVEQVDKSKIVVQKALDEAQLLFDSLMQKYFG